MTEKEYGQLVESMSPESPKWKDCICAFVVGGLAVACESLRQMAG